MKRKWERIKKIGFILFIGMVGFVWYNGHILIMFYKGSTRAPFMPDGGTPVYTKSNSEKIRDIKREAYQDGQHDYKTYGERRAPHYPSDNMLLPGEPEVNLIQIYDDFYEEGYQDAQKISSN